MENYIPTQMQHYRQEIWAYGAALRILISFSSLYVDSASGSVLYIFYHY